MLVVAVAEVSVLMCDSMVASFMLGETGKVVCVGQGCQPTANGTRLFVWLFLYYIYNYMNAERYKSCASVCVSVCVLYENRVSNRKLCKLSKTNYGCCWFRFK